MGHPSVNCSEMPFSACSLALALAFWCWLSKILLMVSSNWKSGRLVLQCGSRPDKQKQSWGRNRYSCWRDFLFPYFLFHRRQINICYNSEDRFRSVLVLNYLCDFWSSAGWLLPLGTSAKLLECSSLCWLLEVSLGGYIKSLEVLVRRCPTLFLVRL